MRRTLRKVAEDEFENLGGAPTLRDSRVVDAVTIFLHIVDRKLQSYPGRRRAPLAASAQISIH
jgi:hypothetical protein